MSSGANRWLVRLRDSGRVHPNPVFQQSYAFIKMNGRAAWKVERTGQIYKEY